ncbi:hypothetical protein BS17DRAFT_703759 [Gyrodon lividus]|nr:hypothetical protein BS17DRAFT_703759 [Gyrodon lividus]
MTRSHLYCPYHSPPECTPGIHYTHECAEVPDLDPVKWLWPKELKFLQWLICDHKKAFAWDVSEHGSFDKCYFPPVNFAMVPHTLWV